MKDRRIGKHISIAYKGAIPFFTERMALLGLCQSHHGVLFTLYRQDGITQEKLSKMMHVDKATVTRSVKKLIEQGFVERKQDEYDKRAYLLFITEKGRNAQPDINRMLEDWNEVLLEGFSDEESAQLMSYMERISDNVIKFHKPMHDSKVKECCNGFEKE